MVEEVHRGASMAMATTTLEEKRRQTIERNKRKLAQLGVKSAAKTIKKQVQEEEEEAAVLAKKKKKKAKIDPEISERAAVLSNMKKQIATAKVNAQRAATIEAQKQIEEKTQ